MVAQASTTTAEAQLGATPTTRMHDRFAGLVLYVPRCKSVRMYATAKKKCTQYNLFVLFNVTKTVGFSYLNGKGASSSIHLQQNKQKLRKGASYS